MTHILCAWFLLTACGKGASAPPAARPAAAMPAPAPAPVVVPPELQERPAALLDPSQATAVAPERFRVRVETTAGDFVIDIHRDWAPNGVDRFYNLVQVGFYDDAGFFRTIDGFMAQFGIPAHPAVSAAWASAQIPDDPVTQSNMRGRITFAKTGKPNSRTTQLFVNYADGNSRLDDMGFAPFGEIVEGMEVVDALHRTGEGSPRGPGPDQNRLKDEGNTYLDSLFPRVDRIVRTVILD